jgi:Protein of unknown function (DUF3987)
MTLPTLEPLEKALTQTGKAVGVGGENGENGLNSAGVSPLSPSSTVGPDLQRAIFPVNSWFARYMDFARTREESADCYLIGAIIPVVAAILGRKIAFAWGDRLIYPNLFAMLAGKPGDRKSSAINLAEKVAHKVLDPKQFLPDAMSAEALFDEYDEEKSGSPDKILIADDANPFLGLLQKTNYGERIGQRLLNLYDCKGLYESFRRNEENNNNSRRNIAETSTCIVLGATFNICQFHGHGIRSGLQRRVLYYIAEKHGRLIAMPPASAHLEFLEIIEKLKKLSEIPRHFFSFGEEALKIWTEFQKNNRQRMHNEGFGNEAHVSRLNGQPEQVIKLAMIFEISVWLEKDGELPAEISAETLKTSIEHSEQCLAAAKALESISTRAEIQTEADTLVAKIAVDFPHEQNDGWIELTRTQLTAKYAAHAGRNKWSLSADDLYSRLIPDLIRRGKAREIPRPGKPSAFAFHAEDF